MLLKHENESFIYTMPAAMWLYLYWSIQVKLVQHTYSCLFGTFLCNNAKERGEKHTQERTCSVWSLLRAANKAFKNLLYSSQSESVCIIHFTSYVGKSLSNVLSKTPLFICWNGLSLSDGKCYITNLCMNNLSLTPTTPCIPTHPKKPCYVVFSWPLGYIKYSHNNTPMLGMYYL